MISTKTLLIIVAFSAVLLAACSSSPKQAEAHEIVAKRGYTLANVADIEVKPDESDPSRVDVWATGPLPSRCVKIGQTFQDRTGNDITIVLTTDPSDIPGCDDGVTAEFVQISPLEDLDPGVYTVTIHGLTRTFEMTPNGVAFQ